MKILSLLLSLCASSTFAAVTINPGKGGIEPAFSLPTQTGNSGKFLTTNGASPSWGTPAGSGDVTLTGAQTITNKIALGINDSSAASALYVKSSSTTTPTSTFKAVVSQTADLMQVLDSSGGAQMIFDSGGNFKFFHNVASTEARFDIRPSVTLLSVSTGSASRFGQFIGNATGVAAGVGSGLALGGPATGSTVLTEYAVIWATKNNATSGDIDTTLKMGARRNTDSKVALGLTLDQASVATIFGDFVHTGSTSGTFTEKVPATITSYSVTWPSAQGAAGTVLTNDGSGGLSWAGSPQGTVCGWYDTVLASLTVSCKGSDPNTSCPTGYTQKTTTGAKFCAAN